MPLLGRRAVRPVAAGLGLAAAVVFLARYTAPGRELGRQLGRLRGPLRRLEGQLAGVSYRLSGRRPDPMVSDEVLTERIRSSLGPLEKRLDMPPIRVTVADHVAALEGDVPSLLSAGEIEHEVRGVSGVRGVDSRLQLGLAEDARPSAGRARAAAAPSTALRRLLDAARSAGVGDENAPKAVGSVLATFAERVPGDERAQLFGHLPDDVRRMIHEAELAAGHRAGEGREARSVADLVGG